MARGSLLTTVVGIAVAASLIGACSKADVSGTGGSSTTTADAAFANTTEGIAALTRRLGVDNRLLLGIRKHQFVDVTGDAAAEIGSGPPSTGAAAPGFTRSQLDIRRHGAFQHDPRVQSVVLFGTGGPLDCTRSGFMEGEAFAVVCPAATEPSAPKSGLYWFYLEPLEELQKVMNGAALNKAFWLLSASTCPSTGAAPGAAPPNSAALPQVARTVLHVGGPGNAPRHEFVLQSAADAPPAIPSNGIAANGCEPATTHARAIVFENTIAIGVPSEEIRGSGPWWSFSTAGLVDGIMYGDRTDEHRAIVEESGQLDSTDTTAAGSTTTAGLTGSSTTESTSSTSTTAPVVTTVVPPTSLVTSSSVVVTTLQPTTTTTRLATTTTQAATTTTQATTTTTG